MAPGFIIAIWALWVLLVWIGNIIITNLLIALQGVEFDNILTEFNAQRYMALACINYECLIIKFYLGLLSHSDFLVFMIPLLGDDQELAESGEQQGLNQNVKKIVDNMESNITTKISNIEAS